MISLFNFLLSPERIPLIDTDMVLSFDGNSLTRGSLASGIDQYFPKEVRDWIDPLVNSLTWTSYGVNSQGLLTMISNAPSKIDPNVDGNKTNVLVVNEDVNDIFLNSVTGQGNYDNMNTYIQARYASGWDYVILWTGYYPRTPYSGVVTQAELDEQDIYIELVANTPLSDADVDMRVNDKIGGVRDQAQDPTYFSDYLHLYAVGYDQVALEVENQGILSIFK